MKTFTLDVYGGGFNGLPFQSVRVDLDDSAILRIRHLRSAVKALDAEAIEEFDHRVEPVSEDEDGVITVDDGVRLECVCLNVTRDGAFWNGYVKHTDDQFETSTVGLEHLDLPDGEHDLRDRA